MNGPEKGAEGRQAVAGAWRAAAAILAGLACLAAAASPGGNGAGPAVAAVAANPSLRIEKSYTIVVDRGTPGAADRGDVIAYLYAVTNSGDVAIRDVAVTDRHGGAGELAPIGRETLIDDAPPYGDSADDVAGDGKWTSLGPGDTVIFGASYTVTQADMDHR